MSDLTSKEQRSVRTTLLFLRVRAGGAWEPVARALHVEEDTIANQPPIAEFAALDEDQP